MQPWQTCMDISYLVLAEGWMLRWLKIMAGRKLLSMLGGWLVKGVVRSEGVTGEMGMKIRVMIILEDLVKDLAEEVEVALEVVSVQEEALVCNNFLLLVVG